MKTANNRAAYSLLTVVLMLGFSPDSAAQKRLYDFQEANLDNGLKIVTLEDFSCPVVAVQVWYHVGSRDEDPKRQGFAHMFEHMMFRGTECVGAEDHFKFIRRTGGDCNAFTSFDNTTYINEAPSNQLEMLLWLEADRMCSLKIDQESFDTERRVVEEERRLGLNRPYGTVPEKVLPVLFQKHPYQWTPIGQIPHLRAATIEELEAFWSRYYVPNNATLVIVGAVKHADAQAMAKRCFDWIPRGPDIVRGFTAEPPQTTPRECKIQEDKGPVPILGYVYRGVPIKHVDRTALEILLNILGGGQSSRLYRDLVKEQKLCQFALSIAFSLEDDGLAAIGAATLPWGDKEKVFKALDDHIARITREPVSDRELTKVKNQLVRSAVTGAQSCAARARLIGEAALIYGDTERVNRRIDEIRAVSIDDLQRVARTYLTKERRTTVRVEPSIGGMIKGLLGFGKGPAEDEGAAATASRAGVNRVAARTGVKASAARPADFGNKPPVAEVQEHFVEAAKTEQQLPNGLKVVVIPNDEIPFVSMTLGLKYGGFAEDPRTPGVAAMALSLLTQGTRRHSAAELAEEIEFNALTLGGSASLDVASVQATCVSDKTEKAMELLAEVVLEPTFAEDEFKVMQQQQVMGLMISSKEPSYLADREFRKRLYGDHPYSRTATGEVEDVQRLKPAMAADWWKTFARPDQAVLYIAGDVKPEAAIELATKFLGGWKADGTAPQISMPTPPVPGKTHIFLMDRPGSVQSQIRVGHLGVTRDHPKYFATRVFNQIFGGAFDSRLNKAIRVEKGLTYGAGGGFSPQRFGGELRCSTFSKTPQTAETVKVLMEVVRGMQEKPPTDEELSIARSYLSGSFAGDRETVDAHVNDAWLIEYSGLPADYFKRGLNAYRETKAADVTAVATELVKPRDMTIMVVGDAARVKKDLEAIAPVTVINPKEQPTEAPKPGAS